MERSNFAEAPEIEHKKDISETEEFMLRLTPSESSESDTDVAAGAIGA